jgi:tetratricopeptide (TPR) repeat protein
MRKLAVGLLWLLCASAALAQSYANREEATRGLASAVAMQRADAINWFAENGRPSDTELLRARLTDDNAMVRGFAEQALWSLWMRSGDKAVDALMTRGVDEMRAGDYKAAIATFSQVIKKKPAFAEGWNKRATVYYLTGEYKKSIADCDEVVKRNPHHFGAIAGFGQNYFELKQYDKAIKYWRRALDENPNMITIEMNIDGTKELLEQQRKNSA